LASIPALPRDLVSHQHHPVHSDVEGFSAVYKATEILVWWKLKQVNAEQRAPNNVMVFSDVEQDLSSMPSMDNNGGHGNRSMETMPFRGFGKTD